MPDEQLRSGMHLLASALVLRAMLVVVGAATAAAHTRSSTGFSEIRQADSGVRYDLRLEYEVLAKVTGFGRAALDARTDAPRTAALRAARRKVESYLRRRLRVSLDGVACAASLGRTSLERHDGIAYAKLSLSYACPGADSGSYAIVYGVFADGGGVVDDHTSLADYDLDGERGRYVFDAAHRELAVGDGGLLSAERRFAVLGTEHILAGLDHVVFVVALLLGAQGLVGVLKVATAFTLAHSITLALAVAGWRRSSSRSSLCRSRTWRWRTSSAVSRATGSRRSSASVCCTASASRARCASPGTPAGR